MYIYRHAAQALNELKQHFGAVLVTGPRQTGKTTLIEETVIKEEGQDLRRVSLDDPLSLETARDEGARFFLDHKPPVFIDEIQYAPGLFPYIKMIVDREKKNGLFFMSGSQQFSLMSGVSESLAGRVGIIDILGLSLREIENNPFNEPFCPDADYLARRRENPLKIDFDGLWDRIWRGTLPKLYADPGLPVQAYYSACLRTYIERDVRAIVNVGDEKKFLSFVRNTAARTGQMLNIANLAEASDLSRSTAERWLSILVTANLVFLLRPFHINMGKREIKAPKLYFLETGLAAYLTGWDTPRVLRNGAAGGAFFETFVVAEIIKSYLNRGMQAPLYYYRDKDGREIDLLILKNGRLHPLEIKMTANPEKRHIAAFPALDRLPAPYERGAGGMICCYHECVSLGGAGQVIPLGYL
ncbi:MAG: ATP-binding protein [Treponema sp.]|nr:ATP-binding protein [Treponema sp.]